MEKKELENILNTIERSVLHIRKNINEWDYNEIKLQIKMLINRTKLYLVCEEDDSKPTI